MANTLFAISRATSYRMSTVAPRTARLWELGRFGVAGAVSFSSNLILTILLHDAGGISEEAAFGISLISTSFPMFMLSRYFVFHPPQLGFIRQIAKFYQSWVIFRSIEYVAFFLILSWIEVFYLFAICGAQIVLLLVKFLYWRRFVFAPKST